MARTTTARKPATRKPALRDAHNHCEWLNDRHAGYCLEPGSRAFRHPKGLLGVLFTCPAHALDALDAGKPLVTSNRPLEPMTWRNGR